VNRRPQSNDNDALASAIDRLREELAITRQVLDEILNELQWANRNRGDENGLAPYRRITSMPLDPTAPDWAERLNRFTPADLPPEFPASALEQARLF
jgi:hypothetical protein